MPDLAVHIAAASVIRRALPEGPGRLAVLIGTALPDIAYKFLNLGLQLPGDVAMPTHTPVGVLLMSYGVCLLFQEKERPAVFAGLLLGGLIQLLLDGCKANLGAGAIRLAFPFSWEAYGFELFQSENGIYFTIPAILIALLLEWQARKLGTVTYS